MQDLELTVLKMSVIALLKKEGFYVKRKENVLI